MSAPSPPPDRSVELRQLELQAEERARLRAEAAAEERRRELAALRGSAFEGGRGSAQNYFTLQGLDPNEYASTIENEITRILNSIAPDDPNPGAYFSNVGPQVYDLAETAERGRYGRELDRIFEPNFASQRIPFTLDDPILASIEAEQFQSADDIIKNMLNRGVITNTGYQTARGDLEKQRPGVQARLTEVGTGQLGTGQQRLREVANEGRSTASQLRLGTPFDPYSYSSQADQVFTDFLNNLGANIRAALPGNLFSTSGLATVAGQGQGAQNTVFDPKATAGIFEENEDEEDRLSGSPF